MAEINYVDWDGLVYYDSKIKQFISERDKINIKYGGEVTRDNLPDPSFDNLNYQYKISEEFVTDSDFDKPGFKFNAGTIFQCVDIDNVYLYTCIYEPTTNSFEDLNQVKADIEALEKKVDAIEIPSIEGLASEAYVDNAIANLDIPDPDLSAYYTKDEANAQFIKSVDLDTILENYATKEYTDNQIVTKIAELNKLSKQVVDELPSISDALDNVIYLAPDGTGNYLEYLLIDNKFELIGTTAVDLTGYATEEFVATAINAIEIPDVSDFITSDYLNDYAKKSDIPSTEGLATSADIQAVTNAFNSADAEILTQAEKFTNNKISELSIEDYAKLEEIDNKLENYATVQSLNNLSDQVTYKADSVLFKEDMFVNNALGLFTLGESVKNLSIKDIIIKLLDLRLEAPSDPSIITNIIKNSTPMYTIKNNAGNYVVEEIPYIYIEPNLADNLETSGFYQIKDQQGNIIESGYQDLSLNSNDVPYIIALPKECVIGQNVQVKVYNILGSEEQGDIWVDAKLDLSNDLESIQALANELGITLPNSADFNNNYTLWATLDAGSVGAEYRFIIIE